MVKVTEISLQFKQRITVGNPKGTYDSLEITVGGTATPEPDEPASSALIDLALKLKGHLEKEIDMAAKTPSTAVENLKQQKETAMGPAPTPVQPPQFTRKPAVAGNACVQCGRDKKNSSGPRCYDCYKEWSASRAPR